MRGRRRRRGVIAAMGLLTTLQCCTPSYQPGLPEGSPFLDNGVSPSLLPQGVAVGDVTDHSALVWFRTAGDAKGQVEWRSDHASAARSVIVETTEEQDFTAAVRLDGLVPGTTYEYRVLTADGGTKDLRGDEQAWQGRFTTASSDRVSQSLTFIWSGDLGGQHRCRRPPAGYAIFDQMAQHAPFFAVLLGDLIYADDRCPAPPNVPGSDFLASSLSDFRAKHRYQRGDESLKRFLAAVPVYAMWDDHEVKNNFSGPVEPLMPAGRRALLEYWPISPPPEEPNRLYRQFRHGADLEIFLLDTRQYRSPNTDKDGPHKTMLGTAQRQWLLDGLSRSNATWKVIVTSVPLSNQKGGTLEIPGNDSWARGADGTGFQTEINMIVGQILERHIDNVVWLAGDVHYAQVNAYDPDRDGHPDFHEFICGPLSARHGRPVPPNPDLNPTTLFSQGEFSNFGAVTVDRTNLTLDIIDEAGAVHFTKTFTAAALSPPVTLLQY